MPRRRLATVQLGEEAREALQALLQAPKLEVIPLKSFEEQMSFLPKEATVTVTASPTKGLEATVDLAVELKERGFVVIPHLAARMVRDRAHLEHLVGRLDTAGINRIFVIGGDADRPGEFPDGLSLLAAIRQIGHFFSDIGVASHPEGHPFIPDHVLLQALRDKQPYAHYMTTQMCFDPRALRSWIGEMRAEGIALPVHIGLPGVAPVRRLLSISARIGIGDSIRFLSKYTSLVGRLVRPGGYTPDELISRLAPTLADPAADITGFHIFTFNQVETTEQWRRQMLAELAAAS